jgi:hypothetical protein
MVRLAGLAGPRFWPSVLMSGSPTGTSPMTLSGRLLAISAHGGCRVAVSPADNLGDTDAYPMVRDWNRAVIYTTRAGHRVGWHQSRRH